jgi:ferredoxin
MPQIRFVSPSGALLGAVEAARGDLVIDVARLHDIPLHWRCGLGTCGTCRIHLRHAGQPGQVELQPRTRNVMQRAGLLADDAPCQQVDDEQLWRLACHLVLQDDDLTVIVPPPVS